MDSISTIRWLLLLVALVDPSCSIQRTLRSWLNPNCTSICNERNVTTIHLRADGPNDTLHYIWDFVGNPSILLAVTSPTSQLNIDWENFISRKENSLTFTEVPFYTFGVAITKIVEFNDTNDSALINIGNATNINVLHPEHFRWERKSLLQASDIVGLNMEGNCYNDTAMNIARYGSIKLSLKGFCTLDHSETVPHMLHTENTTEIDVVLDHMQTNSSFSSSRFAFELVAIGDGKSDGAISIDRKKSLDDEHTPGIFELVELKTPPYGKKNSNKNHGAFMQWRPISYISSDRDVLTSTETVQYPPSKIANHTKAIENSMLYCYYGKRANHFLAQEVVVSLGSKGDGFYKRSNYSTWTLIIGYGTPPCERFSSLVIMIISIGLGLPLLIMFVAGIYACIQKMPKRQSDTYISR